MVQVKKCEIFAQPAKPLEFLSVDTAAQSSPPKPLDLAIAKTLEAYIESGRKLLTGKYADHGDVAIPQLKGPTNITVIRCTDAIFVRYDSAEEGEEAVGFVESDLRVSDVAPRFSDQLIHFPEDPRTYAPSPGGIEFTMSVINQKTGNSRVALKIRPLIYGKQLPKGFHLDCPPARPPFLLSIYNQSHFYLGGELLPSDREAQSHASPTNFLAHSQFVLPVGWKAIEIFPIASEEYWKPGYAPTWAELDILAAIAQRNLITAKLVGFDGRGATRREYARLLKEFESLLEGPEEPVYQFLKRHPELLCPTYERCWPKLAFGDRVSDFVFRESHNDYLLVELEAPVRELFRKDGQQRAELTHAINQVEDWIQFIVDNRPEVENKLRLAGISPNPRALIVIGRSVTLTEANRRKLGTIQDREGRLRIMTYDDVLDQCRAYLERLLGPLGLGDQVGEFYYYKQTPADGTWPF